MKADELLPDIIRQISNGRDISVPQYLKYKNIEDVKESTLRNALSFVRKNFYTNYFHYRAGSWSAISLGFVNEMLLTPEEAVILSAILRKKENLCGSALSAKIPLLVNKFKKRTLHSVYRSSIAEPISTEMEKKFALLRSAIDKNLKINFIYPIFKKGPIPVSIFPQLIFNIEYYWYMAGIRVQDDGTEQIRYYSISKMEFITFTTEVGQEDKKQLFRDLRSNLRLGMNAYFKPNEGIEYVRLLVIDFLVDYIERADYFEGWKNTQVFEDVQGKTYVIYDVPYTDKEYRDIIPTIQKYMPDILILDNDELYRKVKSNINNFLLPYGDGEVEEL